MNIDNRDYWIKVTGMLQENWALINDNDKMSVIYFLHKNGKIFDQMEFETSEEAIRALKHNGFFLFANNIQAQEFIVKPEEPFSYGSHPNGKIYSSGKYWKAPKKLRHATRKIPRT